MKHNPDTCPDCQRAEHRRVTDAWAREQDRRFPRTGPGRFAKDSDAFWNRCLNGGAIILVAIGILCAWSWWSS